MQLYRLIFAKLVYPTIFLGSCFVFYPSNTWECMREHSYWRSLRHTPAWVVVQGYNTAVSRMGHKPVGKEQGTAVVFEINLEGKIYREYYIVMWRCKFMVFGCLLSDVIYTSNKSVDILQQTCYQQVAIRIRLRALRLLVDDKSVTSCQQTCCKFILKTCYQKNHCKLCQQICK